MQDPFNAPIKVISLWQPWASLMAAGYKIDETRHWKTSYRGPLAIHAAKTIDVAGAPEQLCRDAFGQHWSRILPVGMVLAVGELTACVHTESVVGRITAANLEAGNFSKSRYAWRVKDIRPLTPMLPLIGRQGLFNWEPPADLVDHLGPAVDHDAACRYIGWGAGTKSRAAA